MDAHCIGPTVPTWSPALCRTCDRFEFWICFYFQTWFQSWSSWSHFVQLISLFKILCNWLRWRFFWRFSWRLLQLVKFSFLGFLKSCKSQFFSDLKCTKNCLGVVLSVMLPPSCLLWYWATTFSLLCERLESTLDCPLANRPRNTKSNED